MISASTRKAATEVASRLGVKPVEALLLAQILSPVELAQALGQCAHVPAWLSWPSLVVPPSVRDRLPAHAAVEHRAVPIAEMSDGDVVVGMVDPLDERASTELGFYVGARVQRVVVPAPMCSSLVLAMYDWVTPFQRLWQPGEDARITVPRPEVPALG